MDLPEITTIKKIVKENYKVKTFYLDKQIDAKPGQFIMAWLPGVDEKPFTLSNIGKETAITVEEKGKFTKELFKLKKGDKIELTIRYNYSSKPEDALIDIKRINEQLIEKHLYTNGQPDPELLIRTGGRSRLSNFLLWQTAYSEFYFTTVLWPDFDKKELKKAIDWYQAQKRNFGK